MPKKERVEVIDSSGIVSRKLRKVKGNKVIIRKRDKKKHNPAYLAKFDESCFIYYFRGIWPFRWTTRKLQIIDGMDKCISFKHEKGNERAELGRYDVKEHWDQEAYHKASTVKTKMEIPFILLIILMFGIILQIVNLLVMTGRLSI